MLAPGRKRWLLWRQSTRECWGLELVGVPESIAIWPVLQSVWQTEVECWYSVPESIAIWPVWCQFGRKEIKGCILNTSCGCPGFGLKKFCLRWFSLDVVTWLWLLGCGYLAVFVSKVSILKPFFFGFWKQQILIFYFVLSVRFYHSFPCPFIFRFLKCFWSLLAVLLNVAISFTSSSSAFITFFFFTLIWFQPISNCQVMPSSVWTNKNAHFLVSFSNCRAHQRGSFSSACNFLTNFTSRSSGLFLFFLF